MGLSSAEMIGKAIANSINQSQEIKQDAIPAEIINSMLLAPVERTKVTLTVVGNYKHYPTTSFILDHPVYGELDSSTLQLDGGYSSTTSSAWTYTS